MKVLGTGGALAAGMGAWNDLTTPVIGVPMTVIGLAAFGAFLGQARDEPEKNRKKMYWLYAGNVFMSVVCVAILPHFFGWDWVDSRLEGPLAGLFAYASKVWIPAFLNALPDTFTKVLPEMFNKIMKLGEYKEDPNAKAMAKKDKE